MQGLCKVSNGRETLFWRFCQGFKYDLLHYGRDFWVHSAWEWWCSGAMLHHEGKRISLERGLSNEPLIDDNGQRILVTGQTRLSQALFWGCIVWCPYAFALEG